MGGGVGADGHDVVVVGGGFAGVTAARELEHTGHDTVLVEARDRLGGRTWTASFAGQEVELGGTWVHWFQPHVWAELRRYGFGLVESPAHDDCVWVVGDELRRGTAAELLPRLFEGSDRLCHDSAQLLPRPHDPFFCDISAVDRLSVRDRLEELHLDEEDLDPNEGLWAGLCSAYVHETGLVAALRWHALAGWSTELMLSCSSRYKIEGGTRRLIEAIAADGGFEVRLGDRVEAVEAAGDGVTVQLADGSALTARALVVAVPLNVLGSIEFTPHLSAGKREAAESGQSSHGVKTWARVRGERGFFAVAPSRCGLTYLSAEYTVGGDTLVVGFGPDASILDPTDGDAVAEAIRRLVPDAEVVDVCAHDWTSDELSRGTWSMPRQHAMTRYLSELQRPEGRVFLAGSDLANGWNGFIDGAVESGLTVARAVNDFLAGAVQPELDQAASAS
jgi:monoamine oxidase